MADNPFVITPTVRTQLTRVQSIALLVGAIFTILTLIQLVVSPTQFFRSWSAGFIIPFALGLGSLAVLMLQYMSGGAWGMVTRRQLEAGARTMPLVFLFFIPLFFGMPRLYEWADKAKLDTDKLIRDKSAYLNPTWWSIRAIVVFAIWMTLAFVLTRLSQQEEETGSLAVSKRLTTWSAGGLVLYVFTLTSATTDWWMSMNDHWFSTIFALIFLGGQGLTVVSLALITTTLLMREQPMAGIVTKRHLHDLGNLLFMFTLFWTYVSFSQLVIIWSGNLPSEITWYIDRMNGGWGWIGMIMIFLQWMLPFLILLSQKIKRNPNSVRTMAIWVLVIRMIDAIYMVEPNYHGQHFFISWSDITALLGMTGLWVWYYVNELKKRPLIPYNAPDLGKALTHGRAH